MDWIQFPFEVDAHVHLGEGAPVVRQRWVFTDQPFVHVPGGCVLMNRIWNSEDPTDFPVGMLRVRENNYEQDARWRLPAGFTSNHQCEPKWFATGEPWPTTLPPTHVDDYWIPHCCGSAAYMLAGGLELGGAWGAAVEFTEAVAGGLEIGGAWGAAVEYVEGFAGGLEIGGEWGATVDYVEGFAGGQEIGGQIPGNHEYDAALAGGLELGGEWGAAATFTEGTAGGMELGGSVGQVVEFTEATAGGMELGGSFGAAVEFTEATAGGLELGGSVGQSTTFTAGMAGGLEIGGAWGAAVEFTEAVAGGLEIGGSFGEVFVPPGPSPGPICASAQNFTLGTLQSFSTAAGVGTSQWWHLSTGPASRTITSTGLTGGTLTCNVFDGAGCSALHSLGFVTTSPQGFGVSALGNMWLQIVNNAGGVHAYTFTVT